MFGISVIIGDDRQVVLAFGGIFHDMTGGRGEKSGPGIMRMFSPRPDVDGSIPIGLHIHPLRHVA
ncbi:hypothetical protein AWC30_01940 [Mycolicibacillus trivialis]|uniref:Uncharacterized protein n=1 Tax=Mycolicibacillus trivialis TaxID=1798 RepID=A0A1X2EQB7_9MYCO|nr:hypothetical protein AWC30_01940 [Mycolicibacillus trivialis]